MQLLLLLLVPAVVFGFDSSFNYGCQNGKCTFQLVVPKEVAQLIDENTLNTEVSSIVNSLSTLNNTITKFSDAGAATFTDLFDGNYTVVNDQATSLNTSVNSAVQNATGKNSFCSTSIVSLFFLSTNISSDLLTASSNAATLSALLYNSIPCFQSSNPSYTCFSLPTTAAPATTQSAVTTGNPSTGDVSTVTGGSTGAPISTVPFTGSTDAPVTGGSTEAPGTSSATDSSSPATSGASSTSGTSSTSEASTGSTKKEGE